MEVKAGYKQTEVGIIPEDWKYTSVEQLVNTGILEKPLDGNHGEIHPKSGDFVSYGIPFVMANNIQNGHVDLENCAFIRKEQADGLRIGFSYPGDVLLTHKATIGNTAIVGNIPFEYIMLTPQVTYYRVADKKQLNNYYLRHFFDSSGFQRVMSAKSGGGTRAYIGVSAQLQLPVVLPSTLAEQEAIAEALSDADALIEALEQLIAKKRQVKQGAMQELLRGKRRLPGLSGKWETKKLGEFGKFYKGKGLPKDVLVDEGKFPAIPYTAIYTDFKEVFDITSVKNYTTSSDTVFINNPHVLIAGSSNMLENVGKVCSYDDNKPVAIGGDVILYKTAADVRFISYLLNTPQHRKKIVFLSQGSTIRHVYISTFMAYEVEIPTLKEQIAIAEILSDMDAEITALEAKLAKARQVKQGMMQELLTGRVRLV